MNNSSSLKKTPSSNLDDKTKNIVDWRKIRGEKKRQLKEWKEMKLLKKLGKKSKKGHKETSSPEKEVETSVIEKEVAREVPTVSVAIPGSILDNAQSQELQTLLAGQIARAASISCVDEVIVYDEAGSSNMCEAEEENPFNSGMHNSNVKMARILQYLECPQYLRKYFFPLHKDLKFAGLLPPLDSPHHLRESDKSNFREGVILDQPLKDGWGSFVNVGLHKSVQLDKKLDTGLRVTVRLEDKEDNKKRQRCQAVDPRTPRTEEGTYWGYNVRVAQSLGTVFAQCPYRGGYDLTIGTSDKGDSVDDLTELPSFRHLLIVFGGVKGLEYALDCDESLTVDDPKHLFHHYINSFPGQGSRTIRTEEAVLVTMAMLRSKIQQKITLSTS